MKPINRVYKKLCHKLLKTGQHVGQTLELTNVLLTIDGEEDFIVTLKSRDLSMSYLAGELLWYMSGRNDLDMISKFSSFWNKLSDDGTTCNSAYGHILFEKHGFDQVETITKLLQKDRDSRRAVLNLNVPNRNVIETKDEPCTTTIQFLVREGRLQCTASMRSNDIFIGFPYDIVFFREIQKLIARRLNIPVGSYHHFTASLHVYERDIPVIKKVAGFGNKTISHTIDIDQLLAENTRKQLVEYIDTQFANREDFTNLLMDKNILIKEDKHVKVQHNTTHPTE